MPAMERRTIWNNWYPGFDSLRTAIPQLSIDHPSEVKFHTTDYKKEFFDQLRQKMGKAAGAVDTINGCQQAVYIRANTTSVQQQADNEMRKLAQLKGQELHTLPDDMLLRVKTGKPETDLVYTVLINKAFSNISTMLGQNFRREPQNDTITIYPGFIGSYPDFYFSVEKDQLGEFVDSIRFARTEIDIDRFYSKFGIRRTNPEFWQQADWFNEQHKNVRGLNAGLLDLSRYDNL